MNKLKDSLPAGTNVSYVVFSDSANEVPSKKYPDMNKVTAKGGTNIMKGVNLGIDVLNQNQSTVTKKVLVLLSDGEATAGVEPGNRYTSEKFRQFTSDPKNDVYTVGFALDNPKLKEMAKGDGEYIYAKNTEALNSAFTELSTRIAAMIVDPMSNDVTYVSGSAKDGPKENENFETVKGNITLDSDGRTLRWTPMDTDSFSNTVIQYTYRVKLDPSEDAGNYTGIKLNNPTYLQYGIEQNGNKTAYTGQFNIPEGFYKVSTLEEQFKVLDENGNASEITDSVQKPHAFQSKVTDYGMTDLEVYAPNQALDTTDEHVKYVYQYSELDGKKLTEVQEDGTYPLFGGDTLDVTNQAEAHTLVHYYAKEYVNSVTYEYTGEVPEDLNAENEDMLGTQWYPRGSERTKAGEPTSDKYNFSGWTVKSGNVEFKENGTFDLTDDVVFEGSWTIKPSYQVEAYYYTCVDGKPNAKPDNEDAISLTGTVYVDEDGDVQYTIQSGDYTKYDGKTVYDYEVAVAPSSTGKLEKGSEVVTDITPSQETTTVTLYFYHDTKTPVEYTVTHKYYNVDPDNNETLVDANTAVDTYRGEHEETIQAADVPAKNVDTYTETGRSLSPFS